MAKIEFSAQEIEHMKKVADVYHNHGVEKAKAALADSGITVSVSENLKALAAPNATAVKSDGCYACITCLLMSFVAFVGFTS